MLVLKSMQDGGSQVTSTDELVVWFFFFLQLNHAFHVIAQANRSKWCMTGRDRPDWALGAI